jgi:hypothetical protein
MTGRCLGLSKTLPLVCCACTAAAACFRSEDVEIDFCSITSDMLRFFRMGFLCRNELVFDNRLTDSDVCVEDVRFAASGPYSHVTSQSFNLTGALAGVKKNDHLIGVRDNEESAQYLRQGWAHMNVPIQCLWRNGPELELVLCPSPPRGIF